MGDEIGLTGYPPDVPDSANLNLVLPQTQSDPISGSSPLRASVCDVALLILMTRADTSIDMLVEPATRSSVSTWGRSGVIPDVRDTSRAYRPAYG